MSLLNLHIFKNYSSLNIFPYFQKGRILSSTKGHRDYVKVGCHLMLKYIGDCPLFCEILKKTLNRLSKQLYFKNNND